MLAHEAEATTSSEEFYQCPAHSMLLAKLEEGQFRWDIRRNFLVDSLARAVVESLEVFGVWLWHLGTRLWWSWQRLG